MAYGLPDQPPEGLEFQDSLDDETCPNCGWDTEPARLDHNAAFNGGILLAVEIAQGSPFGAMGGAQVAALYFRCPSCHVHFTTEEESFLGAMT